MLQDLLHTRRGANTISGRVFGCLCPPDGRVCAACGGGEDVWAHRQCGGCHEGTAPRPGCLQVRQDQAVGGAQHRQLSTTIEVLSQVSQQSCFHHSKMAQVLFYF